MSDPEILALRELHRLASARGGHHAAPARHRRARPAIRSGGRRDGGESQRRRRAGGMDHDTGRRSRQRRAVPAWRRLCHRLARQPPPRGGRSRPRQCRTRHWRSTTAWRRSTRSPPPCRTRSRRIASCSIAASSPGRICIAGDSAGGGLVVAAMLAIRGAELPQPGCGWCISPWVDLACTGASMRDNAARDPTVQKAGVLEFAGIYLAGADPRSPLASPIHGDLRGLPPLLIQVGSVETLLDDSLSLARVAGLADVPGRSADLARDDPCLAPVPSHARRRPPRHRGGRRVRSQLHKGNPER